MVKRDQIGVVVIVVLTLIIILIGQVNCGRQSSEFFKGMIPKSSSSSTAHDHHHHHHEDYFLVSKPKGVSIPPSSPSKQHYDIGLQSSTNSP
ncbi:hypothetical protein CsatB_006932 [Cannabis sativa]